ncbi:hypothetical protein [Crossiella sp. CA198]
MTVFFSVAGRRRAKKFDADRRPVLGLLAAGHRGFLLSVRVILQAAS